MILIPVDNDPRLVTTTSIRDRIVSTKLHRLHNVIRITVATLEAISY